MSYSEYKKRVEQDPEYIESMKSLRLKFSLGNAVIKARLMRGLSQTALAKAIGTKQANISRIESGLGNPTLDLIQRLANVLALDVSFVVNEIEIPIQPAGIPVEMPKVSAIAEKKARYRKSE